MADPIDITSLVEKVRVELAATKVKIADNDGWDLGDLKDIFELIVMVVSLVEAEGVKLSGLTGKEKKDVAVETLNWLIDVPFVPEFLEDNLFSIAVDMVVSSLNKWLGDNWLEKVNKLKG